MPQLSSELLNTFSFLREATSQSIRRGSIYYQEGRVFDVELVDERTAVCLVAGNTGQYTVEIALKPGTSRLWFDCDCPYEGEGLCKHIIAAALELRDYLKKEERGHKDQRSSVSRSYQGGPTAGWQERIMQTMQLNPRRSMGASHSSRYAVAMLLNRSHPTFYNKYNYGAATPYWYTIEPLMIKEGRWDALREVEGHNPARVNGLLKSRLDWVSAADPNFSFADPHQCLNLKPEAISFISVMRKLAGIYGGGGETLPHYLSIISRLEIPLFLAKGGHPPKVERWLKVLPSPIPIQVDIRLDEERLSLLAGFESGRAFHPLGQKIEAITTGPVWLLMGDTVAQLEDGRDLQLLREFPIEIPRAQAEEFRDRYLPLIAQALSIRGDLVSWRDVHAEPVPRLYLQDDVEDRRLRASLHFGYGEFDLPLGKDEDYAVMSVPGTWELARLHRQPQREQHFYQLLTDPLYRLKRTGKPQPHGTFELRARAHPFDFLMYSIPALIQAGFEIYGEENLKSGRINRNTPTLRVSISSGIDWFDLKTVVEFGDQQVSFHDVRRALKRGEKYIKLADGSIGQIPAEWLEKYRHLWGLAQETEQGFRVGEIHLSLLDSLLQDDPSIQAPQALVERRERLRRFEEIVSHLLPAGFQGELRPYQKHGYDWLHFLHTYRFGGILADDMGLGKTVQVLAYLQSLKEQAGASPRTATLLVVPKSLVTNWQREAARFTPGLRLLEHAGNFRSKDVSLFNDFDVIVTTYGTMLRDVDALHKYRFDHIILDESQAIKNPLAKSAKAARLLKADHRLVMTGTPVENNTFELWSQFAFLNPGLLGSMEYFKKEFANPIEAAGDEQAAGVLKKLVYPFILRRTKDQVALELPPRSERVYYIDMDPAQKKLYAQTREKYRAELLGLIESEGIHNARFKVLEGLLRLRQIAIHPQLVDRAFTGTAPKLELLLETLETLQAENHKALVFSQFVETFKLVRQELDKRRIPYVYLDGRTPKRQLVVDRFQGDASIPFFLISLKAGGVGLNLTAADYVIHLDPWWNPAVEMQASDRAHRIGQTKPVFIYKIIARGTVEEKILQLQEKKQALVRNIIATEAGFFKSLTQEDVKVLFQ